jgi:hypothetical protein
VPSRVCVSPQRNGNLGESGKPTTVSTTVMQRDGEIFILGWEKWLKLKLMKRFSRNETGKQTFEIRCVENWCTLYWESEYSVHGLAGVPACMATGTMCLKFMIELLIAMAAHCSVLALEWLGMAVFLSLGEE